MKKIIAMLMVIMLCLCICSCGDDETAAKKAVAAPKPTTAQQNTTCSQQAILILMESNLDCHNMFYMKPLTTTTQQNSDGYLGVDPAIMKDYDALKTLVNNTYSKECAQKLLSYPSKENPLYKNVDGCLFTKPDVAKFDPDYVVSWDDCTVEIIKSDNKTCEFKITTQKDSKPYSVSSTAVYENGKWLFTEVLS